MANPEYIQNLRAVIGKLHGCDSEHVETVPVHEIFRGKTVWNGIVEVFDLTGHPRAKHAYAWSHLDGKSDQTTRSVAVLEIPPVISPETAVKASVISEPKSSIKLFSYQRTINFPNCLNCLMNLI